LNRAVNHALYLAAVLFQDEEIVIAQKRYGRGQG
jgi:hypothetical protein